MICAACNQTIEVGSKVATGPSGDIHYDCFKRSTAHAEEIDDFRLLDKIDALAKRVQDLEKQVEALVGGR